MIKNIIKLIPVNAGYFSFTRINKAKTVINIHIDKTKITLYFFQIDLKPI